LKATVPGLAIGIFVNIHKDVTVQNGDVDGFGFIGVLLQGTATGTNAKNTVRNVKLNDDEVGVQTAYGQSNEIEFCSIDGGDIGILSVNDKGGTRFFHNNLAGQKKGSLFGLGLPLLSGGSLTGTLSEDNVITKGDFPFGEVRSTGDRLRFDSGLGFSGALFSGGTDLTNVSK